MPFTPRKQTYSASRSRRTSRHLRSATYGTHVTPVSSKDFVSKSPGNASSVGFSNGRKSRRANHGYVNQIAPSTTTRESAAAYSERMNRRQFSQEIQHKSRVSRVLFIALAIVLVVGIGSLAAYLAFFWSLDSKLSAQGQDYSSALTEQTSGQPYYVLVGCDVTHEDSFQQIDALALARVDETNKQISLVVIPYNKLVSSGDTSISLTDLYAEQGEAKLLSVVSSEFGVSLSHFVQADKTLFTQVIDDIGGVDVTVSEAVDDPTAGSIYISVGSQTLSGAQAAVYLKASNYTNGEDTQLQNQATFLKAFAQKFLASETDLQLASKLDGYAPHLFTDWKSHDLFSVEDTLRGTDANAIYASQLGGYSTTLTKAGTVYVVSDTDISTMMAVVEAGNDPGTLTVEQSYNVDKSSFEITVKNGAGITGGASAVAQILTNAGFKVASTGNAESYVYTETLVIYLDTQYETAAKAVAQALGTGRVINGANYYTFDTAIQVVLGSDYKPIS